MVVKWPAAIVTGLALLSLLACTDPDAGTAESIPMTPAQARLVGADPCTLMPATEYLQRGQIEPAADSERHCKFESTAVNEAHSIVVYVSQSVF